MEVDIFDEADEDLIRGVETLPLLEDLKVFGLRRNLRMVEALAELLLCCAFHRLPLQEVPRYEHVQSPHRGRVDPLYGIAHKEDDPGVRHQVMDAGYALLFEDRVLWRDLTLRLALRSPEERGIPAVRRGTLEVAELF